MALEPVQLDDLTWSEMVLAIRRRIAAVSGERWTLHAPVDPGVTLLELFAWLLEQRIYWMDQTPDSFVRAALALLGESAGPAQSAATVLQFPARAFEIVPAPTEMRLMRRQPQLIFSTEQTLTLLPVERIGLHIAGQDRTSDVEQGRVVRLFPAEGGEGEIQIVLWLNREIPSPVPVEPFALLFDLRSSARIRPLWSPDAATGVEPPAAVSWLYRCSTGAGLAPFAEVDDGTGGFRRPGIVKLRIPGDWMAEGTADPRTGLIPYALRVRVARSTFTSPPRLSRIVPNVAIARHLRQTRQHSLDSKWLPLPGRVISLTELPEDEPEKDHPLLESTVRLQIKERDGQWHDEWRPVPDLTFHGPGDRVFVVDRERGELHFGDGLTGRIPVLDRTNGINVRVQYQVGGGRAGDVGENLNWERVTDRALTARNVFAADGGQDPETIEAARERIAALLKQRDRAIIQKDYEELALTTPGVAIARAHAAVGFHPDHPCAAVHGAVTVFIVPEAPREQMDEEVIENAFVATPIPDPGALAAVRARMERARLLTSEVFVLSPRYRPVGLAVTVEADVADPLTLRERIKARLRTFLDPLSGGDRGQGWPFGEPLRPSALLREAQLALGETGRATAISIKLLDSSAPDEDCSDVELGDHELVVLQEFNLLLRRTIANQAREGGLR
jgi:predicted phage baseplate assembly protein